MGLSMQNACLAFPLRAHTSKPPRRESEPIEQRVQRIVFHAAAARHPARRAAPRRPFPYHVHLTPLDGSDSKPIVVLGKHLAPRGLDFYHSQSLPYRRVIASFQADQAWLGLLLDIRWCRFGEGGWYQSGGVFLRSVSSPFMASDALEGGASDTPSVPPIDASPFHN